MYKRQTGLLAVVAGSMYRHKKSKKEAVIALIVGVIAMTAMMCVANYYITSMYMGVDRSVVAAMLVPVIIPFNLLKGGINALVTFLVYKRISPFLHRGM